MIKDKLVLEIRAFSEITIATNRQVHCYFFLSRKKDHNFDWYSTCQSNDWNDSQCEINDFCSMPRHLTLETQIFALTRVSWCLDYLFMRLSWNEKKTPSCPLLIRCLIANINYFDDQFSDCFRSLRSHWFRRTLLHRLSVGSYIHSVICNWKLSFKSNAINQ